MTKKLYQINGAKLSLNFHPGQLRAWDSKARVVAVLAGSQGGKCGQFVVLLADGRRKHVKDMCLGDEVLCLGSDLKIRKTAVTDAFCTGVQMTYRVTTTSGRSIVVTADHPLYSADGWKAAIEFAPGDFIGVPRVLPVQPVKTETPEKMRVMGYLIGDGGLTHNTPMFSNITPEVLQDLEHCLPEPCRLIHSSRCDYRIRGVGTGKGSNHPVREWCKEWGIWGTLAKHKRIPESVFELCNESIAPMLNALFACDGWIDHKGFGFASASEGLIDDVRHLLLRFGVIARKRYKAVKLNGKVFDSWGLDVRDLDGLKAIATQIGILAKQRKLEALIASKSLKRPNTKDLVPTLDIRDYYAKLGTWVYKKGYPDSFGYDLIRQARCKNISRPYAKILTDYFGFGMEDAYSDIYWDTVDTIEPIGEDTVWDITVADGHNFIADDFFAHNTSLSPWWLWREIRRRGAGDYMAVTSSYDLFKLKFLPEMRTIFEHVLQVGRWWAGDRVIELRNPATGQFEAKHADDPMWARIILRSASADGGLEAATAKGAVFDEAGQDIVPLDAFEALRRRLTLNQGRILITTTLYNMGWLKQKILDRDGHDGIEVIIFESTANPAFPLEEFEYLKATMPKWKFDMFHRAILTRPPGMIYGDFIDDYREQGGHKVKPFQIPTRWPRYQGVDPGAVNTAMVWLAHDTDNDLYYLYRESLEGGKSTREHVRSTLEIEAEHNERVISRFIGQKSEVQQRLDWQSEGVRNVNEPPVHDVESGIDRVIALLKEHRLYLFDTCEGILDEMGRYSRKLDEMSEPTEEIKDKAKFHRIDALRYVGAGVTNPSQAPIMRTASVRMRR